MAVWLMALLAKEWWPDLEQIRNGRAMGVMAERAVFLHRRVVAEVRSALLHVTGVAGFVDVLPYHQGGCD